MNNISELIAKARKEKKMTQKELAKKLNVSDKVISKWENGITVPDIDMLNQIYEILDIKPVNSIEQVQYDRNTKMFYSIVVCVLFCLMAYILFVLDVTPVISYIIFCLVFCIFVMLDLICYK